jgi:uncharacterized membrane protein YraQ (UPF0718 family)
MKWRRWMKWRRVKVALAIAKAINRMVFVGVLISAALNGYAKRVLDAECAKQ